MIFTKLILNNFKSYEKAEITFEKGIIIIIGDNGAGKSTILEAINFALFKQYKTKRIDDLIRNGSKGVMSVELEFICNGLEYKIIRKKNNSSIKSTILRKSRERGIFIPICQGDKEVSNQIESILEMDGNLFLNSVYVRQGEIADLVDKKPAEKKNLIGKLLGLDSLENSWKNIAPLIANYENKKANLEGKLDSEENLLKEHDEVYDILKGLKEKGLYLEKAIDEFKEHLESIKQEKINFDREKEHLDEEENKLQSLIFNRENLEKDIKSLGNQFTEIKESENEINELEVDVNKLPIYLDFERSLEKLQQFRKDESSLKQDLEKIDIQNKIIENEKRGYEDHLLLNDELDKLYEEKVQLEKDLAIISQLQSDKKELLSKMKFKSDEIKKIFNEIKDTLSSLGVDKKELAPIEDILSLKEIYGGFTIIFKEELKKVEESISLKNEDKAKFSQAIESYKKQLKELEEVDNKCPVCKSDITEDKKENLIYEYNSLIAEYEKNIRLIETELDKLTSSKKDFDSKFDILNNLSNKFTEYHQKLDILSEDTDKLKTLDDKLEANDNNNSKLGKIILKVSEKERIRDNTKSSFDKYNNAKAVLEVLNNKQDLKYKLDAVISGIDFEIKLMQNLIEEDNFLDVDMDLKDLKDTIDDFTTKKEKYDKLIGFVSNKESIESQLNNKQENHKLVLAEINNMLEKLAESEYDEEGHNIINTEFDDVSSHLADSEKQLSGIKGQAKELIARINKIKDQIKINKSYREEYENINEYIKLLTNIRELFSKNSIQKELRNRSRPLIQKYAKEIFTQFNFNYSDLILNSEYDVSVIGPEGETSLDMVSGGEKIAIALALRLGITQALSKGTSETILLDEPTIFLDAARRHELINLIKDLTLLPQMIIVTHEPQLESAASNLIKVKKVNGISKIV